MNHVNPSRVFFKIDWLDTYEGVECKTLASIKLVIDETPVWPVKGEETDDFEWFADELLAHLAECWKPIILRQNYPIPVQPERPSFIWAQAAKRWAELPHAAETEEDDVNAFEETHNLANAFGGVGGLSPLWFFRDQDTMIIDTQETWSRVSIKDASHALAFAGNKIAERLRETNLEKWTKLLNAWHRRDQGDSTALLALTIGRDRSTAAELIAEKLLEPPISFEEAANDNDELRIAARMAGPMPINQIKSVLEKLRVCAPRNTPRLKEVSDQAMLFIAESELADAKPHRQGNELAIWLRRTLNLSANRTVDPILVLERQFNVDVRAIDFPIASLDAIAVWGPKYGPAVLLNKASRRIRKAVNIWRNGALRVTAAHEICHLLLDAKHAFSAVEVLGGRMPVRIEQRAKAFAAEFLLPSKEAGDVWRTAGYPLDLEGLRTVISTLCRRHNVTESVAAWQLQHGASVNNWEELDRTLDQLVPHR